jgi:Flp pilus assembly pilin Flp
MGILKNLLSGDDGQGVAEYAMMMAVVLTLLVSVVHMIGTHAGDVFAHVASALQ